MKWGKFEIGFLELIIIASLIGTIVTTIAQSCGAS